jgi:hypothetical protein
LEELTDDIIDTIEARSGDDVAPLLVELRRPHKPGS